MGHLPRYDGIHKGGDSINIYVYAYPLPGILRESVTYNVAEDTYTILISSNLSREQQLEAYDHAMRHITNGDFEKKSVQEIEAEAHK